MSEARVLPVRDDQDGLLHWRIWHPKRDVCYEFVKVGPTKFRLRDSFVGIDYSLPIFDIAEHPK